MTAIVAVPIVRESRAHGNTSYDIPGAVTVTAGLVSLVYGFTQAAQNGWTSASTLSFLGLAVVLLAAFVTIELRAKNPLLPMRVVLDRTRGGSFLSSLMVGSGLMGMFLFLTYYFQENLGYSALKTGFAFLPFSAGIILAAGASSKIIPRTGPKPVMVVGLLGGDARHAVAHPDRRPHRLLAHVLPAEILISIGMGLAFVPMSSTALFGVPAHDAGVASATLNTTQQIGGSLGTALLNTVFASTTAAYLATRIGTPAVREAAQIHGYTVGFAIGAVFLAIAALSAGFLIKASREDMAEVGELALVPA